MATLLHKQRLSFKFSIKNNRGFSLLELLIAGLLLVGVVVAFIRVFTPARGFTVTEARLSVERNLDRQKLEDLRQEVRQDRWDSTTSLLKPTATKYTDTVTTPNRSYTREYTVSSVPGRDYRKVTIKVT